MSMKEECIYIGYTINSQDKKYYFKGTVENTAKFIMQNYQSSTVITNYRDEVICRSIVGGYLDTENKDLIAGILPILLRYQCGEKFTELIFKEKEEGIYYAEDLNVPVTGTFNEPEDVEIESNKTTDNLIKKKYFLYQRGLNEECMKVLYQELKDSGYSILKVKNNGFYSLYCRRKNEFRGAGENE